MATAKRTLTATERIAAVTLVNSVRTLQHVNPGAEVCRGKLAIVISMCRSIKRLRKTDSATDDEIRAAALQFVRKISGYHVPARKNEEAFEEAVVEVSLASARLLERLPKLSSAASRDNSRADPRAASASSPVGR